MKREYSLFLVPVLLLVSVYICWAGNEELVPRLGGDLALLADTACSSESLKVLDLLEVKLQGTLPVTLLDRSRITEILREHALSASGLFDASSALRLGQLCGAEWLLYANEYVGIDDQSVLVLSLFATGSGFETGTNVTGS